MRVSRGWERDGTNKTTRKREANVLDLTFPGAIGDLLASTAQLELSWF